MSPPGVSRRGLAYAYVGAFAGLTAFTLLFVYPGFAVPTFHCTPSVTTSANPGHLYCGDVVSLPAPSPYGCNYGNHTNNGAEVSMTYGGYRLNARLYSICAGLRNLGINASVAEPGHAAIAVTVLGGPEFYNSWWNWTSPDNQSGLQWRGSYQLVFLISN